jgi:hypothetical protein
VLEVLILNIIPDLNPPGYGTVPVDISGQLALSSQGQL